MSLSAPHINVVCIPRMVAARKLYAVEPKTPGLSKYLAAVHHFFQLLRDERFNRLNHMCIVVPKQEDLPVKLISYLRWEFVRDRAHEFYDFRTDDYTGHEYATLSRTLEEQMRRMSNAVTAVKEALDAIPRTPSPEARGFPISILGTITEATLHAAVPIEIANGINIFPSIDLQGRMEEARAKFTSFNDMAEVATYLKAVDDLYQLLKSDVREYPFQVYLPMQDEPLSLVTYLSLAFAEMHKIVPSFTRVGAIGHCEIANPYSRAITKVNCTYAATMILKK